MVNKTLEENEWKIEHRDDGLSFIGFPYIRNGKIEYGWTIGPMDRKTAEWIYDAITSKQNKQRNI